LEQTVSLDAHKPNRRSTARLQSRA
jgi:hypothetical protein